jgi:cysteine desulfurase
MLGLRDAFESMILSGFSAAEVIGSSTLRLPQTSNIAFPGVDRQALLMALDLVGVACSTGSACASGSSEPSPVLLAMGLADALVASAIRFSWGAFTTAAEIVESANRILNESNRLRHGKSP